MSTPVIKKASERWSSSSCAVNAAENAPRDQRISAAMTAPIRKATAYFIHALLFTGFDAFLSITTLRPASYTA